ncbi:DNA repair metallo-beta-lactamase-domain-containing protein [Biscogniauxia sp. FL1348]|nr:DNA repair metallo-beta-lactamase-domain-containing protein [Biscogniauxia sp. FL1348]
MPVTPRPKPKTRTTVPRTTQSKLNFGSAAAKGAHGSETKTPKKKPTNGNILTFFKKVEVEEQLFCAGDADALDTARQTAPDPNNEESETTKEVGQSAREEGHDNSESAPKRRKLSHDADSGAVRITEKKAKLELELALEPVEPVAQTQTQTKPHRRKGPFLEDSDSDDDVNPTPNRPPSLDNIPKCEAPLAPKLPADESCPDIPDEPDPKLDDSYNEEFKDLEEIEGLFDDDDFDFGEESRERRYLEAQARLEAGEAGDYTSDEALGGPPGNESITEACPLCNASLAGITTEQATIHVNACLDGNPIPIPTTLNPPSDTVDAPEVSKRFARAAIPRPGQANPISLGSTASQPTSAFTKLMSGHAEDAAWASAAAAEQASRGKPAYQRTCPFYKIMPGFFICVDAFRYGAVKGCKAYFLSHFHSDHYIGLTANWSHGPIYCSKVTASLIKNQLRTATKWIKELEFEEKVEVPGTEGVTVTMLPANHCPGSSLFLFEKTTGKGSNPRTQRILHCGDFRACPAQVTHPLLKPKTVDAISGKTKQQKIDVCYLDTTYLNPRYSFPPQDDVIKACAEFCKSIAGDPSAADRALNKVKREKGSTTVSQFFQKEDDDMSPSTTAAANDTEGDEGKSSNSKGQAGPKNRLLVICGTYSIGKERICIAIAQALQTKIFASPSKIKICSQLGDAELTALLTSNPLEAQVHMQMLMEIRAETLQDYLDGYKPHFTRIVGFRPSGWNFRPGNNTTTATTPALAPASAAIAGSMGPSKSGGPGAASSGSTGATATASLSPGTLPTTSLLHSPGWRPRFRAGDLAAQRGSTREAMCFGVPYSEHSSFRELALFLMSLRIDKVVPTVNVGSEVGRRRMKAWTDRWLAERRKGGLAQATA